MYKYREEFRTNKKALELKKMKTEGMGKVTRHTEKPCCLLGCENNRENPDIMPVTQEVT